MPAISQSRLQRQFNELILVRVAVFREGLEDLREKKGSDGWQKSCWKGPDEGNPGDHPGRGGFYFVSSFSWNPFAEQRTNRPAFAPGRKNRVNRFGSGCALGGKRTSGSGYRLGHESW